MSPKVEALRERYEQALVKQSAASLAMEDANIELEEAHETYISAAREESRRLTREHLIGLGLVENQ